LPDIEVGYLTSIIAVYWLKLVTEICCFLSLWTELCMHIHTYVVVVQHKIVLINIVVL